MEESEEAILVEIVQGFPLAKATAGGCGSFVRPEEIDLHERDDPEGYDSAHGPAGNAGDPLLPGLGIPEGPDLAPPLLTRRFTGLHGHPDGCRPSIQARLVLTLFHLPSLRPWLVPGIRRKL
jgi:hypothetical protein